MNLRNILRDVRTRVIPNILFENAWKNVVLQSTEPGILRNAKLKEFGGGGFLKVVNDKQNRVDANGNIDFVEAEKYNRNPEKFIYEGILGFPVVFSKYSISFSEKINVISGFSEIEYAIATGRNPRSANLAGYILPATVLANYLIPSSPEPAETELSAQLGLAPYYNIARQIQEVPPPDANPIIKLYEDDMRAYSSLGKGKKMYLTGPSGLQLEGQCTGLNIDMSSEMSYVISFSMSIYVSKVITVDSNIQHLSNSNELE